MHHAPLAGETVFFNGAHFGDSLTAASVTYGPPSAPTSFACFLTSITDALVGCKLSPGLGSGFVFRVSVGLDSGGST